MQRPPTERFTDRVESYHLYRPRYPGALVDWLRDGGGLPANATIVDVAAGTGLLSEIFLSRGYAVIAVEPNDEMRAACCGLTVRFPNLTCISGTAEATGLRSHSVDLITVAQALHWFDLPRTRAEFVRVLRSGGWCAVIYNRRRMGGDTFHDGYERILQEFGTDYEAVRTKYPTEEKLSDFLSPAEMRQVIFPNLQELNYDGLKGRILSSSYMPQPGHPRYSAMIGRVQELFAECQTNGHVRLEYDCIAICGHLSTR